MKGSNADTKATERDAILFICTSSHTAYAWFTLDHFPWEKVHIYSSHYNFSLLKQVINKLSIPWVTSYYSTTASLDFDQMSVYGKKHFDVMLFAKPNIASHISIL